MRLIQIGNTSLERGKRSGDVTFIAQASAWLGTAFLVIGIFGAIGVQLILLFKRLAQASSRPSPQSASRRASTYINDDAVWFSWLAWLAYAAVTLTAFLGEMFTLFSNAGFGYVYIMLGMPAFLVAWLGLVINASVQSVPSSWLFGALGAAALIVSGYANIN